MSEIERWATPSSGLLPSRGERQFGNAVQKLQQETKFTGHLVDAAAAVAGRSMDRVADLDRYRVQLAGNDPVLDSLLREVEVGFVLEVQRIQRRFGSGSGS